MAGTDTQPRAEATGSGKKSTCMYKIKEKNWKSLNFQICVIYRLNHGNWNGKGISGTRHCQLFLPRHRQNSLETEDGKIWSTRTRLEGKDRKQNNPHLQTYKIHEKDFTVPFQSQKNKNFS